MVLILQTARVLANHTTKYFACDLLAHYTLRRLARSAKGWWKIEQNYQELQEELGLDHYEGRSWTGWHHHVAMGLLAQAFLNLERLRHKRTYGWTLPQTRREIQSVLSTWTGSCVYRGSTIRRSDGAP